MNAFEAGGMTTSQGIGSDGKNLLWQVRHREGVSHFYPRADARF
jgi:hypothetical protein